MAYADFLSDHLDGLGGGVANNPIDFTEALGLQFDAGVMRLPFTRDVINESAYSDRRKQLDALGLDFGAEARKTIKQEPGVIFGESSKDYAKRLDDESHRLADDFITKQRAENPDLVRDIKTTQEIRDMTVAARQFAEQDAEMAFERRQGPISGYGAMLLGNIGGAMTDPVNALTLPLGAGASTGVLRAMLVDGAINMGIEAYQTPENAAWAKEAGVEYGVAEAVTNILTAGAGGAAISGIIRGGGKFLGSLEKRGKSAEVLDKISRDKNIPSEGRDAALYQSRVAHIDEANPVTSELATADEVAAHRNNLQEVRDAIVNNREPVIDETIFVSGGEGLKKQIEILERSVSRLESASVEDAVLPRALAGAKPRYKTNTLEWESDIDRVAYIVNQTKKSPKDAEYREFLNDQGMTDAEIASHGAKVKAAIKKMSDAAEEDARLVVSKMQRDVSASRVELEGKLQSARAELGKRIGKPNYAEPVPPAPRFDKGVLKGSRYEGYTKPSKAFLNWIEGVVKDLNDSYKGQRIFSVPTEAGRGGDLDVTGYKGNYPAWFQDFNKTGESISREYVNRVLEKIKAGKALGKKEANVAEVLYREARAMREENIRQWRNAKEDKLAAEMDVGERMLADEMAALAREEAGIVEPTQAGEQSVIPGAERITDRQLAERKMEQPLKGGNKPLEGGLFDVGARGQADLLVEPIVPERISDPVEELTIRTKNMLDPKVKAAMIADFNRAVESDPDFKVEITERVDGEEQTRKLTMKDLDAEINDDLKVLKAISVCGIGK
jgi:hypothetical protein